MKTSLLCLRQMVRATPQLDAAGHQGANGEVEDGFTPKRAQQNVTSPTLTMQLQKHPSGPCRAPEPPQAKMMTLNVPEPSQPRSKFGSYAWAVDTFVTESRCPHKLYPKMVHAIRLSCCQESSSVAAWLDFSNAMVAEKIPSVYAFKWWCYAGRTCLNWILLARDMFVLEKLPGIVGAGKSPRSNAIVWKSANYDECIIASACHGKMNGFGVWFRKDGSCWSGMFRNSVMVPPITKKARADYR